MLTKRQTWRRVKSTSSRLHHYSTNKGDIIYEEENLLICSQKVWIEPIFNSHSNEGSKNLRETDSQGIINDIKDNNNCLKKEYPESIDCDIVPPFPQSLSFPEIDTIKHSDSSSILSVGSSNLSLISFAKSELDSLLEMEAKCVAPKAVSFCHTVRVCLVPSRNCLQPYCAELFWSPDDYKTFKNEAIHEIKAILDARHSMGEKCSPRDVKNALYQPTIYPDLSQSLLSPEETKSEAPKLVVNLESDFIAELIYSSTANVPSSRLLAAMAASDVKNNNNYRGQFQQYSYSYHREQQYQQPYQHQHQYSHEQGHYHFGRENSDASLRVLGRVDSVQLFKQYSSPSSPPRADHSSTITSSSLLSSSVSSTSSHHGRNTTPTASSGSANSNGGGRRQLDLTVIPAVLV